MSPIIVAILVGFVVFAIIIALIPKHMLTNSSSAHLQTAVRQLRDESSVAADLEYLESRSLIRDHLQDADQVTKAFFTIPGTQHLFPYVVRGGLEKKVTYVVFGCIAALGITVYFTHNFGPVSILLGIAAAMAFGFWIVNRAIRKRKEAILEELPEALEMMVRSVRAGYPLSSIIRMISENMPAPINEEFKQVADEMAHGSSIIDALRRMARRVDEPDVGFFSVVLTVQQEVGGNLAEVLSNLANLIRRRKALRLKVLAITAEGRTTMWVLASLPIIVVLALNHMSPSHVESFFLTTDGKKLFGLGVGIYLFGIFLVRKMVHIRM
ncbi:MAG: type II secretion system F family protein [Rickettsiales bacterium]|nr:type II secretion system F family protein [Rickettsiales bacterium]